MFTMAGVTMRQYQPIRNHILLDFASAMALNNGNRNGLTEEQKLSSNALVHATDANATARFQELILNEAGYDPVDTPSGKRNVGVLSWDDWFMAVAFLTAKRSKDPNTQVSLTNVLVAHGSSLTSCCEPWLMYLFSFSS
jgi:hypothetical protein